MKKLSLYILLSLFVSDFVFAKILKYKQNFSEDITTGYHNVTDYDVRSAKWRMTPKAMVKAKPPKYIMQVVKKSDGYPVRLGKESLRFEVRSGDSWGWDAKNDRERAEIIICCLKGTTWHAWSIFLPHDFQTIFPVKVAMGQFHNDGNNPTEFMFQNQFDKKSKKKSGGYWITPAESISDHISKKLLEQEDMLGKWNDVLVNVKWTHKKKGFLKLWINGKLTYEHKGKTKLKGDIIEHQLGIYRSFISRGNGPAPTQVVYYDEIRYAKKCYKLRLYDLGYKCKKIKNQSRTDY